jgi:hypothetical protein
MILKASLFFLVTMLASAAACSQPDPIPTPCDNIPANGCPDDSECADACCADPCCAAAYSCNDGTWSLEHTCSSFNLAACLRDSGSDSPTSPVDAACFDAAGINLPSGASASQGPGCIDLEPPDCPLGEVLSCNPNSTDPCFGCASLFYCQNGNWIPWGICSDDGGVAPTN